MTNFFTTFLIENKKAVWQEEHIQRILFFAKTTKTEISETKLRTEFDNFLSKTNCNGKGQIIVENSKLRFNFSEIKEIEQPLKLTFKTIKTPLGNIKKYPFRNLGFSQNQEFILVEEETNEILEGNFTNIFLEKNGIFYTPPATNKILNGICRQQFIKYLKLKHIKVEKKILYPDDLKSGKIFLTNSLRGVMIGKMDNFSI